MVKQILIGLLIVLQYQVISAQPDSLKFGLKGKVIRSLGNSPTSPNAFYAGLKGDAMGTGLVYKSNDFGKTWHPMNNGQSIDPYVSDIQAIEVSRDSENTIYAGTWKNGLFKSIDDGKTWKKDLAFPSTDIRSIKAGIQTTSLVYAATSDFGVVKSTDGGNIWKRCSPQTIDASFKFVWSVELDKKNDNVVYAQTYKKGVWKSMDQGETWKQILDTPGKVCWDLKISNKSNEIWVASSKGGDTLSSVYHSIDSGNTWKEISNVPQVGVNQINVIEDKNRQTVIIGSWQKGAFILRENEWIKLDEVDFDTISEILINDSELLIGSWGNGIYQLKL